MSWFKKNPAIIRKLRTRYKILASDSYKDVSADVDYNTKTGRWYPSGPLIVSNYQTSLRYTQVLLKTEYIDENGELVPYE